MEQKVQLLNEETSRDTHAETFLGILFQRINPQEALEHYESAIDADPTNAYAYYGLGSVYESQGDLGKALNNYRKAKNEAGDVLDSL